MALTYTPPGELGSTMPNFELPNVLGGNVSSTSFSDANGVIVMFICNHCPYVKAIEDRLIKLGNDCKQKKIKVVAICSNDPTDYEEDSFENLKSRAEEKSYPFLYLFDETQSVAKEFGAVCTPDFFVYKNTKEGSQLYYRGRLDDSWKDSSLVTKNELMIAIDNLISDKDAPTVQIPSMGCSIKWKE